MTNLTALLPTFDALKPGIAADFVANVTKRVERLIAEYPTNISKLSSEWGRDGNEYRQLRGFITGIHERGVAISVNHEYIAKFSKQYADDQIAAFTLKLVKKVGNLNDVVIHDLSPNSFTFLITGKLGVFDVRIEQNRIINVSPKGTPFHQWPSRIYVEGKFTPESAYKKIAGAVAVLAGPVPADEAAPATLETADLPLDAAPEAAPAAPAAPIKAGEKLVYSVGTVRTWNTRDGGGTAGTLLCNGTKVAEFENGGYGGPTDVRYVGTTPEGRAAHKARHAAYCAAQPDHVYPASHGMPSFSVKFDAECHVDLLVTEELTRRDYKKLINNKIAVVRPDGQIAHLVGSKPTPAAIAQFKANPKHAGYKVLNEMTFDAGFALYAASSH